MRKSEDDNPKNSGDSSCGEDRSLEYCLDDLLEEVTDANLQKHIMIGPPVG